MARAFAEQDAAGEFDVAVAGPRDSLTGLGVERWGNRPTQVVNWDADRLSPWADLGWRKVDAATSGAHWYFPHWDVPWLARPRRSIVLVSDVIPLVVPGATSLLKRKIAERWIRRSAEKATRVVLSTAFTRSELIAIWPDLAGKATVLPLGVDDRFFGAPPPLPEWISRRARGAPFMISVGNRKPHKNLAMGPEVLARVPEIHWIVVGEEFAGWDAVLDRAAKLGVAGRIHVLGSQPDEVIHGLYSAAVCLFFPSRNEGFGLPILEALAAGTRVVAGRAGASVEVLAGHGHACDLDDPEDFASAVSAALHAGPPGPEGRSHAANFTWERSARVLAGLFREIAG